MKNFLLAAAVLAALPSIAQAQQAAGATKVTPDTLTFAPTAFPDVKSGVVTGDTTKAGVYSVYVVYGQGAKSTPHTHPDARVVTILKGTAYMGFSSAFNEAEVKPYNAGEVIVIPPNTLHYTWAKDGVMMQQETGYGPSGTVIPSAAK